jgi:hypothetical protein
MLNMKQGEEDENGEGGEDEDEDEDNDGIDDDEDPDDDNNGLPDDKQIRDGYDAQGNLYVTLENANRKVSDNYIDDLAGRTANRPKVCRQKVLRQLRRKGLSPKPPQLQLVRKPVLRLPRQKDSQPIKIKMKTRMRRKRRKRRVKPRKRLQKAQKPRRLLQQRRIKRHRQKRQARKPQQEGRSLPSGRENQRSKFVGHHLVIKGLSFFRD